MLNFGASKPRVKGGPGPRAPLDPRLNNDSEISNNDSKVKIDLACLLHFTENK